MSSVKIQRTRKSSTNSMQRLTTRNSNGELTFSWDVCSIQSAERLESLTYWIIRIFRTIHSLLHGLVSTSKMIVNRVWRGAQIDIPAMASDGFPRVQNRIRSYLKNEITHSEICLSNRWRILIFFPHENCLNCKRVYRMSVVAFMLITRVTVFFQNWTL